MNAGHLIIAADCGIQIGTGHVMRCLALAQAWKRSGGNVIFLLPAGSPRIEQRIHAEGLSLQALEPERFERAVVQRLLQSKPRVAVLDGYGFGAQEQAVLSQAGIAVLAVDDYGHTTDYPVRWILNQNAYARPEMFARRGDDTRLLLGPGYALLRDEFLPWLGWQRSIPEKASKILVTIGGSDPDNLSLRILESLVLLKVPQLQVVLAVGGSNPHFQALQSAAERLPLPVRIVRDAADMPDLMAWAEVAVSGAGGTSYELCYMGLPSLLFVIAHNQQRAAESLAELSAAVYAGAARDFDRHKFAEELRELIESKDRRLAISRRARELVDGLGAERVGASLKDREMKLRPLRETDCRLLFSWANDPVVRNASFHSGPVQWEAHQRWFLQKLQDPQSVIYIGENCDSEPVGQTRFHLEGDRAILSVVIAPNFRGAGWGKELIAFSTGTLVRSRNVRRVEAFVKPDNQASIGLFESVGFRQAGNDEVAGQPALLFVFSVPAKTSKESL